MSGDHMKTEDSHKQMRRAGFSMIEVLVASTILVVIVMMLAMLFQQTSLAWRTGVQRANRYMQVRSAIGSIQRDASAAVDARYIPTELKTKIGDGQQSFSGSQLKFYTLNGAGFVNNKPDKVPLRALSYITYKSDGTRTETVLNGLGSAYYKDKGSRTMNFLQKAKGSALSKPTLDFDFAQSVSAQGKQPAGNNEFPLFITIKATFAPDDGNGYDIGAASAGPDKVWNTKDDIRTWVEK